MTRALIRAALVITLVTAAVFLLIRLVPGDPVVMVLGEHATDEAVNQLREQLHLNDSLGGYGEMGVRDRVSCAEILHRR